MRYLADLPMPLTCSDAVRNTAFEKMYPWGRNRDG